MARLWLLCLVLWTGVSIAEPRRLKLGLLTNVPEATGAEISWNLNRYVAIQGTYSWILPITVEVGVPGKKLVSEGDFSIRSPYLDIPFAVDFGPQASLGVLLFPFGGSLYLGLGAAQRRVTIKGAVSTPVYFDDKEIQVASNSVFDASVQTRTDQQLLRMSLGQRFLWGPIFSGWYLGAVQPVSGRSQVQSRVRVENPNATDGAAADADNLEEARLAQEEVLKQKMGDLLHKFERQTLPLLGLEIGWAF